jgi:methylglutaconyl-CoA hydratase
LLGLLPATISPYVLRRIGASNARRLMLNAHRFTAEEAVSLGLIAKECLRKNWMKLLKKK